MLAFNGSDLWALWVVGIHREYGGGLETAIRPGCYDRGLRAVSIAVYRPRSDHIRGRPDVRRGDWCNLGRFASPLARSQYLTIYNSVFCFRFRSLPHHLDRVSDPLPHSLLPWPSPRTSQDPDLRAGMRGGRQCRLELIGCWVDRSQTDQQRKVAILQRCRNASHLGHVNFLETLRSLNRRSAVEVKQDEGDPEQRPQDRLHEGEREAR